VVSDRNAAINLYSADAQVASAVEAVRAQESLRDVPAALLRDVVDATRAQSSARDYRVSCAVELSAALDALGATHVDGDDRLLQPRHSAAAAVVAEAAAIAATAEAQLAAEAHANAVRAARAAQGAVAAAAAIVAEAAESARRARETAAALTTSRSPLPAQPSRSRPARSTQPSLLRRPQPPLPNWTYPTIRSPSDPRTGSPLTYALLRQPCRPRHSRQRGAWPSRPCRRSNGPEKPRRLDSLMRGDSGL
jgi:hypothetical protein